MRFSRYVFFGFISQMRIKTVFIPSSLVNVLFCSGGHLLSHTVSSAVPSAVRVLTIVFGMGTGVSPGRIATRNFEFLTTQQ